MSNLIGAAGTVAHYGVLFLLLLVTITYTLDALLIGVKGLIDWWFARKLEFWRAVDASAEAPPSTSAEKYQN